MCSRQSVGSGDDLHGGIHHGGPANPNRARCPSHTLPCPNSSGGVRTPRLGTKGSLHPTPNQPCSQSSPEPGEPGVEESHLNPHAGNRFSKGEICRSEFWSVKPDSGRILHQQRARASRHVHGIHEVPPATSTSILFLKLSCHLFRVPDFHC